MLVYIRDKTNHSDKMFDRTMRLILNEQHLTIVLNEKQLKRKVSYEHNGKNIICMYNTIIFILNQQLTWHIKLSLFFTTNSDFNLNRRTLQS